MDVSPQIVHEEGLGLFRLIVAVIVIIGIIYYLKVAGTMFSANGSGRKSNGKIDPMAVLFFIAVGFISWIVVIQVVGKLLYGEWTPLF